MSNHTGSYAWGEGLSLLMDPSLQVCRNLSGYSEGFAYAFKFSLNYDPPPNMSYIFFQAYKEGTMIMNIDLLNVTVPEGWVMESIFVPNSTIPNFEYCFGLDLNTSVNTTGYDLVLDYFQVVRYDQYVVDVVWDIELNNGSNSTGIISTDI